MRSYEGKLALNYSDLKQILDYTIGIAGDSRFLHLFLLTCFGMISRSSTVSDLRYEFMSMENDAVVAKIPKHKSDQTGEQIFPKHLYAHPYDASSCIFVALGLHYFTNLSPANGRVFQNGILKTVQKAFHKVLGEISPTLQAGFDSEDHGLHSVRKTGATFGSGFPGGPNLVSVFLRASWSIGQVKDR